MLNSTLAQCERNLTSEDQDLMAGLFICILCFIGILGYIPVLFVIIKSPSLKYPVYVLMTSHGVTDIASLMVWFMAGIFTITHGTFIPQAVMDWLMVIIEFGWFSLVCHVAVISFNRYMAVCNPQAHMTWFQGRLTPRHWVLITVTVTFFINILTYVPPGPGFFIDGWYFNWKDERVVNFYFYFDQVLCSLVFLLMVVEYSLIIRSYRRSRAALRNHAHHDGEGWRFSAAEMKRQISLCIQCGIVGLSFWLCDVMFYAAPVVFPSDPVVVFFCRTGSWVFNNAMNPWMYLIFNNSLRHAAKNIIFGNKLFLQSSTEHLDV